MENWNRTTGSKCYILKYDIPPCVDEYFSQAPLLIPGYEEKRSDVVGCCGFATGMQQAYPRSFILRASTVSKMIIIPIYRISEHQTPGTVWFLGFFICEKRIGNLKSILSILQRKIAYDIMPVGKEIISPCGQKSESPRSCSFLGFLLILL